MPIKVTMPALSPTMEEGNLVKWLVKEGDAVSAGDVLAEIETDKATMEVESVDDGIVARLLVAAGSEGVKVNRVIAVLAAEGEDVESVLQTSGLEDLAAAVSHPAMAAPAPAIAAVFTSNEASVSPAFGSEHKGGGKRIFASPLARRLCKEFGLDMELLTGSGPHGRIVARDVNSALQAASAKIDTAAKTPVVTAQSLPDDDEKILQFFSPDEYVLQPHDQMRKTIARRLVQSKQTVPHFYVSVDCHLENLFKLRADINQAAPWIETEKGRKPAYKLSVNDLVIKAVALSLRHHPHANVSWTQTAMVVHKNVDIGVAVAIPGGLMTPIVRDAARKSLVDISVEIKELAVRARTRRLKPEEYQGGSTAVSNMGMYGVKSFSAIINPPQATIFAVGAGEERAIVSQGMLRAATVMTVTLSADHRAVDGVLAAELIGTFRQFIEQPISMLV